MAVQSINSAWKKSIVNNHCLLQMIDTLTTPTLTRTNIIGLHFRCRTSEAALFDLSVIPIPVFVKRCSEWNPKDNNNTDAELTPSGKLSRDATYSRA